MGKRVPPHRREKKKAVQVAVEEMFEDFEADAKEFAEMEADLWLEDDDIFEMLEDQWDDEWARGRRE